MDKKLRELMAMFYAQPVARLPVASGAIVTVWQEQLRAFMDDLQRQAGVK